MNDSNSRGTQSSLKPHIPCGIDIWTFGLLYYLYDLCAYRNRNIVVDLLWYAVMLLMIDLFVGFHGVS